MVVVPLMGVFLLGGCGREEAKPQTQPAPAVQASAPNDQPAAPLDRIAPPGPVKGDEPLPPNHPPLGANTPAAPGQSLSPETISRQAAAHPKAAGRKTLNVVVPEAVKGKWTAVNIAITGPDGKEREVRVPLGDRVAIDKTGSTLRVLTFLPSYTSDFQTVTSSSNEPVNPAIQVQLARRDEVLAEGWVFQNLPDFNSFSSDQVRVRLLSAEPAELRTEAGGKPGPVKVK